MREQEYTIQYKSAPRWLIHGLLVFSLGCLIGSVMFSTAFWARLNGTQTFPVPPLAQIETVARAENSLMHALPQVLTRQRLPGPSQLSPLVSNEEMLVSEGFSAFSLFVLAAALFWLAGLMRDGRWRLTPETVTFPAHMWVSLLFRRRRNWSDIGAVALADEEVTRQRPDRSAIEDRQMVFYFNSGGTARINLSHVSMTDLEKFFKASKYWGSTAVFAPELIELKRKLFSGPKTAQQTSFTTLWEEDLQSHFTATTYVPLDKGRSLQNSRFKVLSQIAAGGLSAIYLAEMPDHRLVVLKEAVVPATADRNAREKAKEMFQREARLLLSLEHPRIASVLDHFVEGNRDYLVLEYIRGQSLRQVVSVDGPQSEERVLDWAQDVAEILQYLHDRSPPVIHRDLSPDNLVLCDDGKLFLIDFGAANEFVGTATGTLIGKQSYIAPEQFRGRAQPASDIYGLGGTLYFLLTGQDPEALCESHPGQVRAGISDALDELVARLTRLELSERVSDAAALVREVEAARDKLERGVVLKMPQLQKEPT